MPNAGGAPIPPLSSARHRNAVSTNPAASRRDSHATPSRMNRHNYRLAALLGRTPCISPKKRRPNPAPAAERYRYLLLSSTIASCYCWRRKTGDDHVDVAATGWETDPYATWISEFCFNPKHPGRRIERDPAAQAYEESRQPNLSILVQRPEIYLPTRGGRYCKKNNNTVCIKNKGDELPKILF